MEFTVSDEQAGLRLDIFLVSQLESGDTPAAPSSRSEVQRLIGSGSVLVDSNSVSKPSLKTVAGQRITIEQAAEQALVHTGIIGADIPLTAVHEDSDIAVIDKPAGMTVHPGPGHESNTLVNAALTRWPHIANVGEPDRPGIVHRLDRDTSGLLAVALTQPAYLKLGEMIRMHEITRIYTALVHGKPESNVGVVDAPIGRDQFHRTRQAVTDDGRHARTHYRVTQELNHYSLLEVRLETGRMHQIRVHMDAIGHPVVGDQTYGKRSGSRSTEVGRLQRQFLHATQLEFAHPISGDSVSVTSDLPADLQNVLDSLD